MNPLNEIAELDEFEARIIRQKQKKGSNDVCFCLLNH